VLQEQPILVVDGAHNGDSAVRLAEAITECFNSRRCHLVFGTSVGKDQKRMFDALLPIAATVTLTRSRHERSAPLESLAATLAERGTEALIEADVQRAVERVLDRAAPDDLVLVTGSLFVVGEVLETFGTTESGGLSQGAHA